MPSFQWLKAEFNYGYDSGNILSFFPNRIRRIEEKKIGGNYRDVFNQAIHKYISESSKILELGSGKGAWTKAILKYIPDGELTSLDFQDVSKWLPIENFNGRLKCIKVENNNYDFLPDEYFDFFWSFGVLCHNNIESIEEILKNSIPKIKIGGIAIHQYGDWEKLDQFGWEKGGIPSSFKNLHDDDIWWPRNSSKIMSEISIRCGWKVVNSDLNLIKRDSIIVLKREN
jgi:SAM-dependent methyltransferase